MAPPSQRRSSYSRRAQYNVFTGYILAGLGALVGAVLLGVSLFQPSLFGWARSGASDTVAPAAETAATVRTGTRTLWESIAGYYRAGSKNAELEREMEIARIRLVEAKAVEQENRRLKALIGLQDTSAEPVAMARLIGSTASSTRRFAYVGVGRRDGVKVGMPVRSPRGVVGRILEVGADSARVLLLTDSESVLPVRRAKDEVVAFAEGRGDGLLRIRLINLGINPLEPGDVFVTSGAGGYYRPGTAVAILTEKTDDGGLARLISDPAATDFVAIDPIFEPEAVVAVQTPVEQELGN
ncbi:rod shape-determining protein MreC [Erythrobacter mangrovi]|uniref:Cell shape-determining protein MreC n=1 Tax=Erythrobacter mangrovi TaxID=2739433 RepID=A0A7D4BGI3_9SPHN|nr:rod shape-determining protein MreC [Erythrobacter mangrovi]QKG71522.1 rod shape-determining protein MreC [Erythrobacter mangrovi]